MGLLNIIRRMHLRQKLSIREIARLTGVSRNTVTKHLAANTIEPLFATPERQSKLDPFAEKLAEDRDWQVAQGTADRKAIARRSLGAWLHRLLCPSGGFWATVESRSASRAADDGARDLCAAAF